MNVKRNIKPRRTEHLSSMAPNLMADSGTSQFAQHPHTKAIEPLLDDRDLEQITGRARSTWQKARLTGDGPPLHSLGSPGALPTRGF
jgi:hypothetical protein